MSSKRPDGRPPKKNASQRAAIAARFKVLCLDAGLKVPEVAQALQVTERTVYAWFAGKTAVPYSAYRLLRILNRFELPGWPGWHMHSGKLWSPEGFGFDPQDGAWWSLLVRQARSFRSAYGQLSRLRRLDAPPSNTGVNKTFRNVELRSCPDGNHGDNKNVPHDEKGADHG